MGGAVSLSVLRCRSPYGPMALRVRFTPASWSSNDFFGGLKTIKISSQLGRDSFFVDYKNMHRYLGGVTSLKKTLPRGQGLSVQHIPFSI